MSTISLIGNTYPIRDAIRAAGFVWNKTYSRWDKQVDEKTAESIRLGDIAAIKAVAANKLGCAIIVDGKPAIVWQSKTYSGANIRNHVSAGFFAGPDSL